MNLLSRLFGKPAPAAAPAAQPILHKDFRIFPAPIKAPGGYRIAARIEKDFPGGMKTHNFHRADTVGALDEAMAISESKAKLAIDQLGDSLFS